LKTIAIFTTSRAEFGLFSALLREIEKSEAVAYRLFVGGAHLAEEYGKTIREIEGQKFRIAGTFDFFLNADTSVSLAKSTAIATYELADIFQNFEFDFVCVLGDRFELLAIVTNAILFRKPIIHIHGGESTEGAIDEQVRHMITKAAHLHFVACEDYAINVRRMGEPQWRIYNTGSLAVDNLVHQEKIAKAELCKRLQLEANYPIVFVAYHPVTLEFSISPLQQIKNVFTALGKYDFQIVITAPNPELERDQIMSYIKQEAAQNQRVHYVDSLGIVQYYSLLAHCQFLIGNSSSGILEVPYFKIPTVNIGDRQQGRVRHPSVIDTDYSVESIAAGIAQALSEDFVSGLRRMPFKFGDGTAAKKMVEIIKSVQVDQNFLRKRLEFPENEDK
jgi:UDP-hydrolysing UDP-N-acetyl-D-glucosamine 2-epimerase